MNIEIERKFLLKSLPSKQPDETIEIYQWYLKNEDNVWERARSCYSNKKGFSFIHTIKTPISHISNMEDEKLLTSDEFNDFVYRCKKTSSRFISKERFIFKEGELKWEVDRFKNEHYLIIAEIEIPNEEYKLNIPNYINDKIILEVTGMKQFSNRSLSKVR